MEPKAIEKEEERASDALEDADAALTESEDSPSLFPVFGGIVIGFVLSQLLSGKKI